jgi:cobalt-zinc-cadmium efflux system outer membrane protein
MHTESMIDDKHRYRWEELKRPTGLLLAIVWFASLGAGCVHYKAEPLDAGKTAAQLEARRLDDPGLKKFLEENSGQPQGEWPKQEWNLADLTLAAFYYHPDLAVARAQWLAAEAGVKTAGARPNPSVSFTPSYDTQIPGNYSPWLLPVTLDIPIETAGKRGKRIAEADAVAESARYSFVKEAWQIRSGVRMSLQDYRVTGRRAQLLQAEMATQREIVKLMQERFDAGQITRPELTTAQIALSHTQMDLSDAMSAEADARSHLAQALGVSGAALEGVRFARTAGMPEANLTTKDARDVALKSRADILGALADYAAAEEDLRLQVAKQYPDLHLGPGYAWNNGNAGDDQWTLGATLEIPILDQNAGPIAEAQANRKVAAAKFVALQAQVIGDIERAVAGLRMAREQLRTGNQLFGAEQQQQKSAEAQLKAGAGDRLDLLNAQLELGNAQLTRVDNEAKLQTALGALEDAVQQPADSFNKAIEIIARQDKEDSHEKNDSKTHQ